MILQDLEIRFMVFFVFLLYFTKDVFQLRKKPMKKILFQSMAFMFALYSMSATAGVGTHFIFDNDSSRALVHDQKVKIDEYDQADDSQARDPSSDWNAPHIQGLWQPANEANQIKYTEAPSGERIYHRYFSVNLSSEVQPVCLIEISGMTSGTHQPRLKKASFKIKETAFAQSRKISCEMTKKTLLDSGGKGDTLYFHFNVGYASGTVPSSPIDISQLFSEFKGDNAGFPYLMACRSNVPPYTELRSISFDYLEKYNTKDRLSVPFNRTQISKTNLYYEKFDNKESVVKFIADIAKKACRDEGGMPQRLLRQ